MDQVHTNVPAHRSPHFTHTLRVSLKADRTTTTQTVTLWTMINMTAERIIKTAQADLIDGAIMLYAVNCRYMCNASPKQIKI